MLRRYSHSVKQVISKDQWAVTGEAGAFIDLFYSPGTDSISYVNCMISEAIDAHRKQKDVPEKVFDILNRDYIAWADRTTANIQAGYHFWDDDVVGAMKILWDLTNSVWFNGTKFRNMIFEKGFIDKVLEYDAQFMSMLDRFENLRNLNKRVVGLLHHWKAASGRTASYEWIDYFEHLTFLRDDVVERTKGAPSPYSDIEKAFMRVEDMAVNLFLLAVEDTMPDKLALIKEKSASLWVNPYAVSLNCENWDSDGLFQRLHTDRDISYMRDAFKKVISF
ncbi:hypothetical protein GZ77_10375 [Endozoicomonas montiporae]|uniref:Uncharacterized protein n=1 Tax=Endozoicomonas montiporae TaxID=1027273 RepID=A0A081N8D3_9GAMM|nr:hypothetical protein [Endozoicomonas montiporae]KEQ14706.1 hypothetical protein GZ77_10375 [Endozoicomonas montiporae]